ncbi:MAG: hypothetical protein QF858_04160 [Candidatus Pacebacteria bacterium]|nr:hypothetical protein [Candidatus Paceibacterota bacterium]MDP6737017.1 hypothetical protein [Nitrospinaceae bacterium]
MLIFNKSNPTKEKDTMVTRKTSHVTLNNAALDETEQGEIILRGVVSPESLHLLLVDDYQREAMPLTALSSILEALEQKESLPDIELGMRGQKFKEDADGVYVLQDDVYIIDGLQRTNAAIHFLASKPDAKVHIGATVHFDTSKEWERNRFRVLNTLRSKVSPNVLLRNKREESAAVLMLFGISTNDKNFVLWNRISWSQRMTKGELLTALMFAKVIGRLHAHKAPTKRNQIDELVPALDKAVEIVGMQNMRENIRTFFELVDECWGVRRVQYREGAVHMRGAFLYVLAQLLSDHFDFWRSNPEEKKLFVEASLKRKLAQFPVHDPQVVNLASSGGKSRELLYMLLRDHINSGKRTKRLKSRIGDLVTLDDNDEEEAA